MKRSLLAGWACMLAVVGSVVAADAPGAEKGHKPTVYLIGDSTVKNGADTGGNGQWGWGHILHYYFDSSQVTVENDARGGTSSRSYMENPDLWPKVVAKLQPGDYVIMQFGHNDDTRPPESDTLRYRSTIKGNGEETVQGPVQSGGMETIHSYGWYIRQYIQQTKEKGATPIVCSMIPRNSWKNGKVNRVSVAGYGLWAKQAAEQGGALFLPLNDLVCDKYDAMGQEKVSAELFPPTPEGAKPETTHPDWAGAALNAACVVEGLKGLDLPVLKAALVKEPKVPAEPDVKVPAARPAK